MQEQKMMHATNATNLADILERVLDKGIVIAGDIKIQLFDLLNIKIRLLVASVDKAMQMGINWWHQDSYLSSEAKEKETETEKENKSLKKRLERLEAKVK